MISAYWNSPSTPLNLCDPQDYEGVLQERAQARQERLEEERLGRTVMFATFATCMAVFVSAATVAVIERLVAG